MTRALRRTPWTGTSDAALPVLPRLTWWGRGTSISARIAVLTAQRAVLTRPSPRARMSRRANQFRSEPRGASLETVALGTAGLAGLTAVGDLKGPLQQGRTRTVDTARAIAEELQDDVLAHDACVLWAHGVRVAVRQARFDLLGGLDLVPAERRDHWQRAIEEATGADPYRFAPRTPVRAIQTAWAAITATPVPAQDPASGSYDCMHLQDALLAAVGASVAAGPDTGTTAAALAGSMLGARWGLSALPVGWLRYLSGPPGLRARDLVRLGVLTARRGEPTPKGWPSQPHIAPSGWVPPPAVRLARLPQLWMGGIGCSGHEADAVVTLCVLGADDVPAKGVAPENHIEPWLVSSVDPADNPNHEFAFDQAIGVIETLLSEGRQVLVHCTRSVHRTPLVVTRLFAQRGVDYDVAKREVQRTLEEAGYERSTDSWATRTRPKRGVEADSARAAARQLSKAI